AEAESRQREAELAHLTRVAMLGELSGSLAHELSQPLTAILSNAEAAARMIGQNADSREEIQEILAEIIAESQHAAEVVRKTRGLLRKDAANDEAVDLAEVVDEVGQLLRRDFVSQGVSFSADLAPDLPSVRGDRVQIVQVLLNLATNACDAMAGANGAGRHLSIDAGRATDGAVQVSVADDGAGIPLDGFERLFEPFVTTKPHGLGLGLAVCRTIVGAHGGRIWATNNADKGASFHFTLPAAEEQAS
ncbi:MAG TPA: ATP-binding protein, partial [Thermoanaerobaculia bacterium]